MADKFVALKKLPFAEANTVFSPDGYLLLLNDLTFNAGKLKYNLKLGVDFRNFIEGKDDSLPVSSVPKSTDDLISDIGSYGAMAYVVYTGYKQGKGVGYYAGYGLLGWALGGILGRGLGKLFLKEFTGDVAEVSQSKEATTEKKVESASKVASDADPIGQKYELMEDFPSFHNEIFKMGFKGTLKAKQEGGKEKNAMFNGKSTKFFRVEIRVPRGNGTTELQTKWIPISILKKV